MKAEIALISSPVVVKSWSNSPSKSPKVRLKQSSFINHCAIFKIINFSFFQPNTTVDVSIMTSTSHLDELSLSLPTRSNDLLVSSDHTSSVGILNSASGVGIRDSLSSPLSSSVALVRDLFVIHDTLFLEKLYLLPSIVFIHCSCARRLLQVLSILVHPPHKL